jgi:hypothetical protein
MHYLSKSDFKVAQTCPTKLFYKKNKYPSLKEEDEYLGLLADGGFMIGKLAQLLYPDGYEIEGGVRDAVAHTEQALEVKENVTLFEPALLVNNQLVRVDIFIKKGNHIEIIEVKSKSYNSESLAKSKVPNKSGKLKNYWLEGEFKPYLEDIAYQKKVVQEKFPTATVSAFLMMPDKSKVNDHEDLIRWFVMNKKEGQTIIDFNGTENDLLALRKSNFMGLESVDAEIDLISPTIASTSAVYKSSVLENRKIITPISIQCKSCEYKVSDPSVSGFVECWGALSEPQPHILDLGQLGNVNNHSGGVINELIAKGKTSLSDVPLDVVVKDKPYYNDRPLFQLKVDCEFLFKEYKEAILNIKFPLHFIDFETCTMAVPFHKGMKPFQNVIFQWSCHTLHQDGTIEHSEWLNAEDYYPNFDFARTLKNQIGTQGTVLTWSSYENTQLRAIKNTLEESEDFDDELLGWLESIIVVDKSDTSNRILDMHDLAKLYYFHPKMGGRTSIKLVLPSVLQETSNSQSLALLEAENLLLRDHEDKLIDPYKLLEERIVEDTKSLSIKVRNGGDAMVAYREMLYGVSRENQEAKMAYAAALKKYCKLDTLAMVVIWFHWHDLSQRKTVDRDLILNSIV